MRRCATAAKRSAAVPIWTPTERASRKDFDLAQQFDVDIDLHLDFDLDPSWWHLEEVCRQTERRNYQGRVAIGHATKLSALPPDRLKAAAARLSKAGVAVTVLPATDLYLMGRDATQTRRAG